MNAMGASSSLSLFKFAVVLLLLSVSAPAFASASSVTADRDLIKEVVEATLRAQEATKEAEKVSIPLFFRNEKQGLKTCAPGGVPCDPRMQGYCCSGQCKLFFFLNFCV